MTGWRMGLLIPTAAFLALLLATIIGDSEPMAAVLQTAWGRVLLADFYLGVLCFAAVIHACEQRLRVTLPWTLGLALLGFPVAVLWLLLRGLPVLRDSAGTGHGAGSDITQD